jgi:archaellum biogenesis protein FlaJ (TadC family)
VDPVESPAERRWSMEKAKKDKLVKLVKYLGIAAVIGIILGIAIIVHSGRMFVLWYNTVLVVCVLMVLCVVGFWVYVAIKGLDNVFENEIRGGE